MRTLGNIICLFTGILVGVTPRQDETGAAFAGSQLQTQLYVNRRTEVLNDAIWAAFPDLAAAPLAWRSPLASDSYREYSDRPFLRVLGFDDVAEKLPDFWPKGGPHWDALGLVHLPGDDQPGVLLAEGKSYPKELFGLGMGAKPNSDSYDLIVESLAATQAQLGVTGKTPEDWCGRLYQSANRLAHLCWLREQGVQTWLVHLLFTGDEHHDPTTAEQWERAMTEADAELGVTGLSIPAAAHITLAAGTREDLVG
jgi:hypothetical protein